MRYLWIALIADFILGLVKINFGLAGLAGIVLSVLLDRFHPKSILSTLKRKNFIYCAAVLDPSGLGIINWLLLKDLPLYAIRQCMPYFGDDQPYHASPLVVIPYYLIQNWLTFIHTPFGIPIGIVLHGCTLLSIYLLISKKVEKTYRQNVLLALAVIGIFFVLYFHEFLVSGVWYRTYWSMPFSGSLSFCDDRRGLYLHPQILTYFDHDILRGIDALGNRGAYRHHPKPKTTLSLFKHGPRPYLCRQ